MLTCGGLVIILFGLFLIWISRDSDGLARAVPSLLGILIAAMGFYLAFFETGEGLARFLPFLSP